MLSLIIWLVLQVGKMAQSCLLRISCFCPTRKSSLFPQNIVLHVVGLANAPSPPPPPPPPAFKLLYFFSLLHSCLVLSQALLRLVLFLLLFCFILLSFCFFFLSLAHLPCFFLADLLKINKNDWYTG